ncbi:YibE/F family protein [Smaragdicoccus niigatensis]|uniref:YibE/F family protein n=1 Tax=Smaragdicoccus niigatensis TaxID=359359 RepID=UPI00036A39FE|nr:YibE/F family protein [Smaragdicoccus niigatensis]
MGHSHSHSHDEPIEIGDFARKIVIGLLVFGGIVVFFGAVMLWPSKQTVAIPLPYQSAGGAAVKTESGTIVDQNQGPCGSPSNGRVFTDQPVSPPVAVYTCQRNIVAIESGADEGKRTLLEITKGPGQPTLAVGDSIRLDHGGDKTGSIYGFYDFSRGPALFVVAAIFAIITVAVARWRGFRALAGLVIVFGVLVFFMIPALMNGEPAIQVAMVAGAAILYAVLYLAHGVNMRTSAALLGTLASMVVATILSYAAIAATRITGLSEEQNSLVQVYLQKVSITGLLLAGFIIGSLGVLNDVTITQASAAFELAALDKNLSRRQIFSSAMRVGSDHIASTVYTLILAYAGGALPLLMLFSIAGRSYSDVLTGDAIAIEIVRSAIGGSALALSVPLTTGIAVLLARAKD